jgi:hypothetical protein
MQYRWLEDAANSTRDSVSRLKLLHLGFAGKFCANLEITKTTPYDCGTHLISNPPPAPHQRTMHCADPASPHSHSLLLCARGGATQCAMPARAAAPALTLTQAERGLLWRLRASCSDCDTQPECADCCQALALARTAHAKVANPPDMALMIAHPLALPCTLSPYSPVCGFGSALECLFELHALAHTPITDIGAAVQAAGTTLLTPHMCTSR